MRAFYSGTGPRGDPSGEAFTAHGTVPPPARWGDGTVQAQRVAPGGIGVLPEMPLGALPGVALGAGEAYWPRLPEPEVLVLPLVPELEVPEAPLPEVPVVPELD